MLKKRRSATHSPRRRMQVSRLHKRVMGRQRFFINTESLLENEAPAQ